MSLVLSLSFLPWLGVLAAFGLTARPFWGSLLYAAIAAAMTTWRLKGRVYGTWLREPRTSQAWAVATASVASAAAIALVSEVINTKVGAVELGLGTVGAIVVLGVMVEVRTLLVARGPARRVAIIGTGHEANELANLIDDHPESGLVAIGCIGDQATADRSGLTHRWLGPLDDMLDVLRGETIDVPILASSSFRSRQLKALTHTLLAHHYSLATSWGVTRIATGRRRSATLSHEPVGILQPSTRAPWTLTAKRALDIAGALTILTIASPLMLLASVAIRFGSRGPVIFRQRRVGRDGDEFEMLKFRTMTVDAEKRKNELMADNDRNGPLFKMESDPRVTRVGRLLRASSIDELPQLISVLRGDMSLVGPRPALPEEVAQFDDELTSRARVRPGITGLWQVEARANPSFDAYRRLDLHYIENWSLAFDLKILFATVQMMMMGELARIACAIIDRCVGTSRDPHAAADAKLRASVEDRSDAGVSVRIGVLGSGFAALQRAVRLLEEGQTVVVADTQTERIRALQSGRFVGCDRPSAAALRAAAGAGRLTFSDEPSHALADCQAAHIYTATPRMASGDLRLCDLRSAVADIAPVLPNGAVIITKPNVDDAVLRVVKQVLANRSDIAVLDDGQGGLDDETPDQFANDPAQSLGGSDEPLASVTELRSRTTTGGLRLVQGFADRPMADAT